jgi:hypothetical protein
MIDLDLVAILRQAADEYERVILRNRQLDKDIIALRSKYNQDITEIRSTPSPKIQKAMVVVDPAKIIHERVKEAAKKMIKPPPDMIIASVSGVSKRANRVLYKAGAVRVRDFDRVTVARLAKVKGCGQTTIAEIKGLAERCGYSIK